jgi:hypothetical protein
MQLPANVCDTDDDRVGLGHLRERLGHGLERLVEPLLTRSAPSGLSESLE